MKKRSVIIAGHATSISIEDEFWEVLRTIAAHEKKSLNTLIGEIDKTNTGNLSSAIRVHILKNLTE